MHRPEEHGVRIQALSPSEAADANGHLATQTAEAGTDGVQWLPYDPATLPGPPTVRADSLQTPVGKPGWERWLVCRSADDRIVGHLALKGPPFDTLQHRCELAMGLELPYRGLGLGKALLDSALAWAAAQPQIDWLDLRVLSTNLPAIALYRRFGFELTRSVPDFCRIGGESIDDWLMSRRLDRASVPVQAGSPL